MAIIVREVHHSRGGSINDRGEVEYTRTFQAITSDLTIGPALIRLATGIPRRYDIYVDADGTIDTSAYCKSVEVSAGSEPFDWRVSCKYSSKLGDPEQAEENPLLRPADIDWGNGKFTTVATRDRDGNAILNSAEEPFDPPVEREDIRLTLKISRNEAFYDANVQLDYFNTTNEDTWFGLFPGQAKCAGISASRKYEKGEFHWRVVYEFELLPAEDATTAGVAWAKRLLDQGWYKLGASGKKEQIVDKYSKPLSAPRLLDGAGGELAIGGTPVFRTFYLYESRAFNDLNLP
jgi:hypothetical protein